MKKNLTKVLKDEISFLGGYARWKGRTPVENELLYAIEISVERMKDALKEIGIKTPADSLHGIWTNLPEKVKKELMTKNYS